MTGAAADIGEQGGTVVDAAIVAALTAMCTEPGVCGPGGGGFLTIDLPGRDPVVIDGYMAFPGKGFSGDPRVTEVEMPYGGGVSVRVRWPCRVFSPPSAPLRRSMYGHRGRN